MPCRQSTVRISSPRCSPPGAPFLLFASKASAVSGAAGGLPSLGRFTHSSALRSAKSWTCSALASRSPSRTREMILPMYWTCTEAWCEKSSACFCDFCDSRMPASQRPLSFLRRLWSSSMSFANSRCRASTRLISLWRSSSSLLYCRSRSICICGRSSLHLREAAHSSSSSFLRSLMRVALCAIMRLASSWNSSRITRSLRSTSACRSENALSFLWQLSKTASRCDSSDAVRSLNSLRALSIPGIGDTNFDIWAKSWLSLLRPLPSP
mmetsp:Transcript_3608/g.10266  ORF Transcript_3608/g.10266 Transcript_3608/m.10266 type:complete len:267 (-) Transcript_3608:696-1496(-)